MIMKIKIPKLVAIISSLISFISLIIAIWDWNDKWFFTAGAFIIPMFVAVVILTEGSN